MELCIRNLTKEFRDKRAVDQVSLTLTPGVWGLLGANGAGKTTLMRMAAGLLVPTKGSVEYDGIPIGCLGGGTGMFSDIFRRSLGFIRNLQSMIIWNMWPR